MPVNSEQDCCWLQSKVECNGHIWRLESSRPSQEFRRSVRRLQDREIRPEMPAFRVFDFVSGLPNRQSEGVNRQKSPATPANIPVLQRLSAETGFDHDCRPRRGVDFVSFSDCESPESGVPINGLLATVLRVRILSIQRPSNPPVHRTTDLRIFRIAQQYPASVLLGNQPTCSTRLGCCGKNRSLSLRRLSELGRPYNAAIINFLAFMRT
jgi:hypothetical protein